MVALLPRRGPKLLALGFAVAALALLFLAQSNTLVLGHRLHIDFAPPWRSLAEAYFLFNNWHLLWYAVGALALIGARRLFRPPLLALTAVVACGLALLGVVFAFTNVALWVNDFTTVNRATLHLAPLLVCLCLLLWQQLFVPATALSPLPARQPALSAADA